MKRIATLAVLAVLVLIAAGCGGKYGGSYVSCQPANGNYQVQVFVNRTVGADDVKAAHILAVVCDAARQAVK